VGRGREALPLRWHRMCGSACVCGAPAPLLRTPSATQHASFAVTALHVQSVLGKGRGVPVHCIHLHALAIHQHNCRIRQTTVPRPAVPNSDAAPVPQPRSTGPPSEQWTWTRLPLSSTPWTVRRVWRV
jgi:hypothetical protein